MRTLYIHARHCVNELVFSNGKNAAKYADPHKLVNILNECFFCLLLSRLATALKWKTLLAVMKQIQVCGVL